MGLDLESRPVLMGIVDLQSGPEQGDKFATISIPNGVMMGRLISERGQRQTTSFNEFLNRDRHSASGK